MDATGFYLRNMAGNRGFLPFPGFSSIYRPRRLDVLRHIQIGQAGLQPVHRAADTLAAFV
jgi:hypothetical protein